MNEPAPSIKILDTTLRDGEQTHGVSFSPEEKTNIGKALLELVRVDRIEVASARVSVGEVEAVSNIIDWARGESLADRVEVLGFIDHGKSVDWIVEAGGRVINLLAKGSEKHCNYQLGKTLDQHVIDVRENIEIAQEKGLVVNLYLEDWSNGYRDNRDFVYQLVDKLAGAGVGHFMLPDTLGVMTPEWVFT
ncbi:MAG: 2-isopropylmalate synthase, partial [Chromatiaceae bacterium]|nr:2-isopropylmalate synthase [Chromatiaceae bacterium]